DSCQLSVVSESPVPHWQLTTGNWQLISSHQHRLFRLRHRLDAAEQSVVLLHGADGNADLVGQARLIEMSDQNALLLEPEVRGLAVAAGADDEDEVGLAGDHAPAHLRQFAR